MASACEYAARYQHVNLITSVGMLATQSVKHLHIHVVPRHPNDTLRLPWGDNAEQSREYLQNAYLFYSGETAHSSRAES
jgi:diadenosine tetraphosphate (Ap4A) HIT family hydrolase